MKGPHWGVLRRITGSLRVSPASHRDSHRDRRSRASRILTPSSAIGKPRCAASQRRRPAREKPVAGWGGRAGAVFGGEDSHELLTDDRVCSAKPGSGLNRAVRFRRAHRGGARRGSALLRVKRPLFIGRCAISRRGQEDGILPPSDRLRKRTLSRCYDAPCRLDVTGPLVPIPYKKQSASHCCAGPAGLACLLAWSWPRFPAHRDARSPPACPEAQRASRLPPHREGLTFFSSSHDECH